MRSLLRLRLVLSCVVLAVAASVALHAVTRPPSPGPSISWMSPAPQPAAPSGVGSAGIPRASAPSTPHGDPGPFAGLRAPLTTLLQRLNADTADNAPGQLALIREIGKALRDHAEQLLDWVVSRR